jgi:hypothetical protein
LREEANVILSLFAKSLDSGSLLINEKMERMRFRVCVYPVEKEEEEEEEEEEGRKRRIHLADTAVDHTGSKTTPSSF